jgi:hypothetical protein
VWLNQAKSCLRKHVRVLWEMSSTVAEGTENVYNYPGVILKLCVLLNRMSTRSCESILHVKTSSSVCCFALFANMNSYFFPCIVGMYASTPACMFCKNQESGLVCCGVTRIHACLDTFIHVVICLFRLKDMLLFNDCICSIYRTF